LVGYNCIIAILVLVALPTKQDSDSFINFWSSSFCSTALAVLENKKQDIVGTLIAALQTQCWKTRKDIVGTLIAALQTQCWKTRNRIL
jgi:hypothetical protein